METNYKIIDYEEFNDRFDGWTILSEKHHHDKMELKYYNEYDLRFNETNTLMTIIICHHYKKKS